MKRRNKIGLRFAGICSVLLAGILAGEGFAGEPNSIGGLLKEKGVDWLTGRWETTMENGEKAEAKFLLEMDGYVICLEAKVGDSEYRGIIFYVPNKKTIVFTGVDNRGSSLTGSCEIEGSNFVMNLEQTTADGVVTKFTRYLSRIDADTMKSVTYVFTDGRRPDEPTGVLEFKRKK